MLTEKRISGKLSALPYAMNGMDSWDPAAMISVIRFLDCAPTQQNMAILRELNTFLS